MLYVAKSDLLSSFMELTAVQAPATIQYGLHPYSVHTLQRTVAFTLVLAWDGTYLALTPLPAPGRSVETRSWSCLELEPH